MSELTTEAAERARGIIHEICKSNDAGIMSGQRIMSICRLFIQ